MKRSTFISFTLAGSIFFLSAITISGFFSTNTKAQTNYKKEILTTKTLYIIRHAKSSHDDPSLKDFDRPLDIKGNGNALDMGIYLMEKAPGIDLMIASPAKRTYTTAKIIAEQIKFDPKKIRLDSALYQCSDGEYMDIIHSIDPTYNQVAFITHNPVTTHIANFLQDSIDISEVPTGAVVAIQFEVKHWSEVGDVKGKLLFFKDPDDIGKSWD